MLPPAYCSIDLNETINVQLIYIDIVQYAEQLPTIGNTVVPIGVGGAVAGGGGDCLGVRPIVGRFRRGFRAGLQLGRVRSDPSSAVAVVLAALGVFVA